MVIFRPMRYRPLFGRILTVLVAAVAAVAIGGLLLEGLVLDAVRLAPVALLVAVLCWALFWAPVLVVEEHAITVRNVFVTHHVPWPAIERIDTKYALTLYTPERRIAVWVVPAPARQAAREATRGDLRIAAESARGADRAVRPGDLVSTESGAVSAVIRRRWEQLRDDGVFDRILAPQRIRSELHLATLVALGGLLVAAVLGALL